MVALKQAERADFPKFNFEKHDMYRIHLYKDDYKDQVVELVLSIQQNEFNIPVTLDGQPDLKSPETFYRHGASAFWVALDNDEVIGTIGLLDIGNAQGVIRKMFVKKEHRGRDKAVAQLLLDELEHHCRKNGIRELLLGTINILKAAQSFYVRNGFSPIDKALLPATFPIMSVDDLFFRKVLIIGL